MGPHIYCFDTSGLIDGLERFYPLGNFPTLWSRVDDLIKDHRLIIPSEVWVESTAKKSPLKDWCENPVAQRDIAKRDASTQVYREVGEIMKEYPTWVTRQGKNNADPFVIAEAAVNDYVVITGETNGGPANPKIPFVCRARNVRCTNFSNLIRLEKWVF